MGTLEDYNVKLSEITAIDKNEVVAPKIIPIGVYIVEAEKLYKWCQSDKDKLIARKLDWKLVKDMPKRINALQQAESNWLAQRFVKSETGKIWKEKSQEAFYLHKLLIREFRFAYRKDDVLLGRVNAVAAGQTQAAMIQGLNDLVVLGNGNTAPLEATGLDLTLLTRAAELSNELKIILAGRQIESDASPVKFIRDQAFTYLKFVVDELCTFGQHVFAEDLNRKNGYGSEYLRRYRQKITKNRTNTNTTTAAETPVESE